MTNAIYEAGFGSSSRAYEGAQLGMTPARFAKGGKGEKIGWAAARSPFGWVIVGATERGLCWLALAATAAEAEASLREEFPRPSCAAIPRCRAGGAAVANVADGKNSGRKQVAPQTLDLRGTAFQLRVWQALRAIPRGETRSYSQLAREMGHPKSTRAVARACALNRVSCWCPAIAWLAQAARSPAIDGEWIASANCWRRNRCLTWLAADGLSHPVLQARAAGGLDGLPAYPNRVVRGKERGDSAISSGWPMRPSGVSLMAC